VTGSCYSGWRGLYAGANAAMRSIAALRDPTERLRRLSEPIDTLPLFREEPLIADLFLALGLDEFFVDVLSRIKGPSDPGSGAYSAKRRLPTRAAGDGHTPALRLPDSGATARSGASPFAWFPSTAQGPQLPPHSSFQSLQPGGKTALPVESRATLAGRVPPTGSPAPAFASKLDTIVSAQQDPVVREQLRSAMNQPVRVRNRDLAQPDAAVHQHLMDHAKPVPGRKRTPLEVPQSSALTGQSRAASLELSRREEAPSIAGPRALMDSQSPHAVSARTAWSGRLESAVARVETVQSVAVENKRTSVDFSTARVRRASSAFRPSTQGGTEPQPDPFGVRPPGLRGLAMLGVALPEQCQPGEAPSGSLPASSDGIVDGRAIPQAAFEEQFAAALRREALRSGISPEEWDQ
jgi:hypothetical protein